MRGELRRALSELTGIEREVQFRHSSWRVAASKSLALNLVTHPVTNQAALPIGLARLPACATRTPSTIATAPRASTHTLGNWGPSRRQFIHADTQRGSSSGICMKIGSPAPASQFLWGTDASLGRVEGPIFELRGLGANRRSVGDHDRCLLQGRTRPALGGAELLVASMEDLTKEERNRTIERACHEYHTVGRHFARFNAVKPCRFVPP